MHLHVYYHDGMNPFLSFSLPPAACFNLYRRKAREYSRAVRKEPPPLFPGDERRPAPWRENLASCAEIVFWNDIPEDAPADLAIKNIPGEPVLWAAYINGEPVGCYYTTPGRAWAALKKRTEGGSRP